jgi:hypothetical protein
VGVGAFVVVDPEQAVRAVDVEIRDGVVDNGVGVGRGAIEGNILAVDVDGGVRLAARALENDAALLGADLGRWDGLFWLLTVSNVGLPLAQLTR